MKTLTDWFERYIGVKEYHGIVAVIQEWFYGYLEKASWCATSMSYAAHYMGMLDQIGGKNENVYFMMKAVEKHFREHYEGLFLYKKEMPTDALLRRGAIVFMLNSGTVMDSGSNKHVTTSYKTLPYTGKGVFQALGGNQSDGIILKAYSQNKIYAVYYPMYGKNPKDYVKNLYKTALEREPDDGGFKYWYNGIYTGNCTGSSICKGFFLGREYNNARRSNSEFVKGLYRGLLMREPDEKGYQYWMDILNEDKETRSEVVKGFWASAEFSHICDEYCIDKGEW